MTPWLEGSLSVGFTSNAIRHVWHVFTFETEEDLVLVRCNGYTSSTYLPCYWCLSGARWPLTSWNHSTAQCMEAPSPPGVRTDKQCFHTHCPTMAPQLSLCLHLVNAKQTCSNVRLKRPNKGWWDSWVTQRRFSMLWCWLSHWFIMDV
jgi:hypothetical protein